MQSREQLSLVWLTAPFAAMMCLLSTIGFAAVRTDGYSHATKAVSELGVIGAPNALAFNLLGFIIPGVLLVVFYLALRTKTQARLGPNLLVAAGALMALAGLAPGDLENMSALTTVLHAIGAIGSGLCWALSLFWIGPVLRTDFGLTAWGRVTPWFFLFAVVHIGWQVAFQTTGAVMPGWGQRIGFVGFFSWPAIIGLLLLRQSTAREASAVLRT